MEVGEKYLVMVTTNNNNKYYHMVPSADGSTFKVEYGRIGAGCQTASYPMSKWDTKYREKIKKGYVDQTDLHIVSSDEEEKDDKPKFLEIAEPTIKELISFLQRCSGQVVRSNYRISAVEVTPQMVEAAQAQMDKLIRAQNENAPLTVFNSLLLDLFTIIPRKMGNVNDHLVKSSTDVGKKITTEQQLLDVMAGEAKAAQAARELRKPKVGEDKDIRQLTILDAMGLEMRPVDAKEEAFIKKQLSKESAGLYYRAWKVVNKKTQTAFDAFMADKDSSFERKFLWHGSRNENWLSIMQSGLVLRPAAQVNGKMFGQGIYFAPRAKKSVGYTSLEGSYWASGRSNRAFMALFEVAYGTPYNVDDCCGIGYNFGYDDLQKKAPGANCLHAHAGRALYNDEIIFYREDQLTMSYIVEIRR